MTGIPHLDFTLALMSHAVQPFNFGDLEQNIVSNEAIQRLLVACFLGGLVGLEREWKGQSAGLRTNLLICLACAFFTLMSPILAGDNGSNKGQVAANIVQGIGFLGAGLILHNRNRISGLASAASIFAVASIGMACGAGLFLPALIATGIVLVAMAAIGFIEWKVSLKKYSLIYEARGSDETAILTALLAAMDLEHQRLASVDRDTFGLVHRVSFSHAATRRRHERLRLRLVGEDAIEVLNTYPDSEED
jgi:putative Mg2+ transporter-C (MgtC) family protein